MAMVVHVCCAGNNVALGKVFTVKAIIPEKFKCNQNLEGHIGCGAQTETQAYAESPIPVPEGHVIHAPVAWCIRIDPDNAMKKEKHDTDFEDELYKMVQKVEHKYAIR